MPSDQPHLLLVEEDPTLADITSFRLELIGYEVTCVYSGEEAHTALAERLPDVIVLDLALSGADGFELTNQLRNDTSTTNIPILAFSTSADLEDVQRAYTAGVTDFLVTPYDPTVLEHKLSALFESVGKAL